MSEQLTTAAISEEIGRNNFAVLGMVSARHQARTVGIVYVVDDRKLYVGAGRDQWKVKHIARNGDVSMTIPIAKRVPLLPWVKIPPATITFSGTARVLEQDELGAALFEKLYRHDRRPQRMACDRGDATTRLRHLRRRCVAADDAVTGAGAGTRPRRVTAARRRPTAVPDVRPCRRPAIGATLAGASRRTV